MVPASRDRGKRSAQRDVGICVANQALKVSVVQIDAVGIENSWSQGLGDDVLQATCRIEEYPGFQSKRLWMQRRGVRDVHRLTAAIKGKSRAYFTDGER